MSADPLTIAFADDLILVYAEAKVIPDEHEIETWYRGFDRNVTPTRWSPMIIFVAEPKPCFISPLRMCHHRWAMGWIDLHCRLKCTRCGLSGET